MNDEVVSIREDAEAGVNVAVVKAKDRDATHPVAYTLVNYFSYVYQIKWIC